jgi:hypothetical protein
VILARSGEEAKRRSEAVKGLQSVRHAFRGMHLTIL